MKLEEVSSEKGWWHKQKYKCQYTSESKLSQYVYITSLC